MMVSGVDWASIKLGSTNEPRAPEATQEHTAVGAWVNRKGTSLPPPRAASSCRATWLCLSGPPSPRHWVGWELCLTHMGWWAHGDRADSSHVKALGQNSHLWDVVIVNRSIEIRALLLSWLLQTVANLENGKLKIQMRSSHVRKNFKMTLKIL